MITINRLYLVLLLALFPCTQIFSQANSTFGVFKDWSTTETRVWGMVKLTDTLGREFDRISRVDSNTVKVEEYNPAATFINSTVIRFSNNHISAIEYSNQWGLLYRTVNYTLDSNHVYTVTDKRYGVNDYLPCKEAKYIFKNDLLVETKYISFSGKPCNTTNGIADIKYIPYEDPDRYNRRKEVSFFDEDGQPTTSKAADYHKVVYDRDKHGNEISMELYDEEGHKLQNRSGTFTTKAVYDSIDNKTESVYCGLNREIKKNIYGVGKTRYEYENGLHVRTILYDDKNNIIKASDTGSGIAITRFEYNADGFMTSRSFFDETQSPINDHSGVHRYIYNYNNRDMLIEEEYFDKNGAPAVNKESIHRYVYGRNDKGREVAISFYGIDNKPTKNKREVVYMKKFTYDANNLLESESYWESENKRMRSWSGEHKMLYSYNELGQQTEVKNYDEHGKLFLGKSGYSRLVEKYDPNARLCEYSRFDDSTPSVTLHSTISNYHSIKLTYDEKNRVTQILYLDTNEEPTNAQIELQEGFLCSKIELKYVANRLTEEWFYPKNSSFPTKTIDCLKNDFVETQGANFGHKNRKQ